MLSGKHSAAQDTPAFRKELTQVIHWLHTNHAHFLKGNYTLNEIAYFARINDFSLGIIHNVINRYPNVREFWLWVDAQRNE
jgi:hypothetical protein